MEIAVKVPSDAYGKLFPFLRYMQIDKIIELLGAAMTGVTITAILNYLLKRKRAGAEAQQITVQSKIDISELAQQMAHDANDRYSEIIKKCEALQDEKLKLQMAVSRRENEIHELKMALLRAQTAGADNEDAETKAKRKISTGIKKAAGNDN